MSDTEPSSEASSEISGDIYLSEYDVMSDIEVDECIDKEGTSVASSAERVSSDEDAYAWADDPVADREWIARYEEDMKQRKVFEGKMSKRLDGSTKLEEW